jgi:hypothetical protein
VQVGEVAGAFKDALNGAIDFRELGARLKRAAPQGVTQGSLFVSPGYMQLPVLQ